MCREAPKVVYELEHMGMPFDRNADGTIYQRPFGGHSANYGDKPVPRACAAADRTGHALLHTLYQSNVKMGTQFFVEWIALDLIRNEAGDVLGVTAIDQKLVISQYSSKSDIVCDRWCWSCLPCINKCLYQYW